MSVTGKNTILHDYVPVFRVRNPVQGQVLSYDHVTKSFTNTQPSEDLDNNLENVFLFTATANGSLDTYVVPWAATNPQSLFITIDGVKQQDGSYTAQPLVDQTIIVFAGIPLNGEVIEIVGYEVVDPASIKNALFTADGVVAVYNIPWVILGKEMVFITVDGIKQNTNAYTMIPFGAGTQVTLASMPPLNAMVEVVGLVSNSLAKIHSDIVNAASGYNLGVSGEEVYSHTTTTGSTDVLNFRTITSGEGIRVRTTGTSIEVSLDQEHTGTYTKIVAAGVTNYDMTEDDSIIGVNSNFGDVTVRLADATKVGKGKKVTIKDEFGVNKGGGDINIVARGGQMIDNKHGAKKISGDLDDFKMYSDGENWFTIT